MKLWFILNDFISIHGAGIRFVQTSALFLNIAQNIAKVKNLDRFNTKCFVSPRTAACNFDLDLYFMKSLKHYKTERAKRLKYRFVKIWRKLLRSLGKTNTENKTNRENWRSKEKSEMSNINSISRTHTYHASSEWKISRNTLFDDQNDFNFARHDITSQHFP